MSPCGAEFIRQVKERIDEVDPADAREQARQRGGARRRPRGRGVRRRAHPRRQARPAQLSRVPHRGRGARPRRARDPLLPVRATAPPGGANDARGAARLRARRVDDAAGSRCGRTAATRSRSRKCLTEEQRERYSRHLLIPEVGAEGQQKLLDAKVLLLGAGGLGSPAALYLAAAGVGTLGIVDNDDVDLSNLQRQVIHNTERIGVPKVDSAEETINGAQPRRATSSKYQPAPRRLEHHGRSCRATTSSIDGLDNFPTRYLLNDASVRLQIPVVSAAILGFEGQLSVFSPYEGPCYRCLFPEPPPAELAPSCGANGVLGVLPGHDGPAPGDRGRQADHRRRASR